MKIISLLLIMFFVCSFVFGDELMIPFSCHPQILVKKFAKQKMKLDLDPSIRTKDSWGFVKNEGANYTIYTYKSVTQEELIIVLKIAREIENEQNNSK